MSHSDSHCLIGINGGIGSGKSMVCKILRALGYDVYDCDRHAKVLMDQSADIKRQLCETFGSIVSVDGLIDRKQLAAIVFADAAKLRKLNDIVHEAVRSDLRQWVVRHCGKCFVESAILYQSGLDRLVSEVWEVTAPREIRLMRVKKRDMTCEDDIVRRMERQDEFQPECRHDCERLIINDDEQPLLPQILRLL